MLKYSIKKYFLKKNLQNPLTNAKKCAIIYTEGKGKHKTAKEESDMTNTKKMTTKGYAYITKKTAHKKVRAAMKKACKAF